MSSANGSSTTDMPSATESTTKVNTFKPKRKGKGAAKRAVENFRIKKNEQFDNNLQRKFAEFRVGETASLFGEDRLVTKVKPDVAFDVNTSLIPNLASAINDVLQTACKVGVPPNIRQETADVAVLDQVFCAQTQAKLWFASVGTEYQECDPEQAALARRVRTELPEALFPFSYYLEQIGKIELYGQNLYPRFARVIEQGNARNPGMVQPPNSFMLAADNCLVPGIPIYVVITDAAAAAANGIVGAGEDGVRLNPRFPYNPNEFEFAGCIRIEFLPANRNQLSWDALVTAYANLRGRIKRRINNAFVQIDFNGARGTTAQLVRSQRSSTGEVDVWSTREVGDDALQVGGALKFSPGDYMAEKDGIVVAGSVDDTGALATLVNQLTERLR